MKEWVKCGEVELKWPMAVDDFCNILLSNGYKVGIENVEGAERKVYIQIYEPKHDEVKITFISNENSPCEECKRREDGRS